MHYSNIAYDIVYYIVYDIVYDIIGDVAVGQKSHACGRDVEGRWFKKKGLSFISNRQRRKEGTLRALGVGGDRTHASPPQWSRVCLP